MPEGIPFIYYLFVLPLFCCNFSKARNLIYTHRNYQFFLFMLFKEKRLSKQLGCLLFLIYCCFYFEQACTSFFPKPIDFSVPVIFSRQVRV